MRTQTLLTTIAVAALGINAGHAQQKAALETTTTIGATGAEVTKTHHLYDAKGNRILTFTEGESETVYTYNDQGQLTEEVSYSFDETEQTKLKVVTNSNIKYTYNAQGQVATRETCLLPGRDGTVATYSYDEHGNPTTVVTVTAYGATTIVYNNAYDAQGHLVSVTIPHPMNPSVNLSATTYTYDAEGRRTKEETANAAGEVTTTTEYSYDAEGQLAKTVVTGSGETAETTYTYADIAASLAPANLTATVNGGNTVTLKWDAVTGAEKYAVFYDNVVTEVSGAEFTTPVLQDGARTFYVASVAGGVAANTTATASLSVEDNTKVGVSSVALAGPITAEARQEENSSGEWVSVNYYNIPLSWHLPESSQPVSYRIYYYESYYYVDLADGSARSTVLSIPENRTKGWSMTTGEFYYDIEIRVVAVYETGEAEPANTVKLEESPAVGIEGTTIDENNATMTADQGDATGTTADQGDATAIFSLSGQRIRHAQRGINLVRRNSRTVKVLR